MTSIHALRGYASLFADPAAASGLGSATRLERLADKSERNDIIQAAHKQRADALDEFGRVENILNHLDKDFEKITGKSATQKMQYEFFNELDRAAGSIKTAVEQWQKGTETLIKMDVLSATSVDVAKDALKIANISDRLFGRAQDLADNANKRAVKGSFLDKISSSVSQNIKDARIETVIGMDNFIRTVLKRDPAEVRAGRFSIIV